MGNSGSFNWAYIGSGVGGPGGAIQFRQESSISGSDNFVYDALGNRVVLSGNLEVSGAVYANEFHTDVTNKTVTNISATGSTAFGDTTDDTHVFTGSIYISGAATSDIDQAVPTGSNPVIATDPALVVGGAAVFNKDVQIKGVVYGASPVKFANNIAMVDQATGKTSTIGQGSWDGDLTIEGKIVLSGSSNDGIIMDAGLTEMRTALDDSSFRPTFKFINQNKWRAKRPYIILTNTLGGDGQYYFSGTVEDPSDYSYGRNVGIGELNFGVGTPTTNDVSASFHNMGVTRIASIANTKLDSYIIDFMVRSSSFGGEYNHGPGFNTNRGSTRAVMSVLRYGHLPWQGLLVDGCINPGNRENPNSSATPIGSSTLGSNYRPWAQLYLKKDGYLRFGFEGYGIDTTQKASLGWESSDQHMRLGGSPLEVENAVTASAFRTTGPINAGSIEVTGDVLIDTATLYVSSSNNGVGIGTKTPAKALEVAHETDAQLRLTNATYNFLLNNRDAWTDLTTDSDGKLTIDPTGGEVSIDGNLTVDGNVFAEKFVAKIVEKTITEVHSTGSTFFGDTSDDVHLFTGSIKVSGEVSSSLNMSASAFYGDGSNLSGLVTTLNDVTNNGDTTTNTITIGGLVSTGDATITGSLSVSGSVYANEFVTNVVNKTVSFIEATGSSKLGDTSDDTHQFTGSLLISGAMDLKGAVLVSDAISADAFVGDGSSLSFLNASSISAGTVYNEILPTNINISDVSASTHVSASTYYGDGSNFTDLNATSLTAGTLNNDRLPSTINVTSLIASDGSGIDALDASSVTAGVLNNARLPENISRTTITASTHVSASTYYGDGSNLTGLAATFNDVTTNGNTTSNTITVGGITSTGDSIITGSLTVSGSIYANEFVANVINKTVSFIEATGSTKFGDTSDDTHQFTGSVYLEGPLSSSHSISGSIFYGDGRGLTGLAAQSSLIGDAEDGTYADGVYDDLTAVTPLGTVVDRFNELFKVLVPDPAPKLEEADYTTSAGASYTLSFDTMTTSPEYAGHSSSAGFTQAFVNDVYGPGTAGEHFRAGIYNGNQNLEGTINYSIPTGYDGDQTNFVNWSADSFRDGNNGILQLFVNGAMVHTLSLGSFVGSGNPDSGTATSLNTSGSGFIRISTTSSARDANNKEFVVFQHRTADYRVHPDDQRKGWNYAQIKHVLPLATRTTNYIEWINDTDASSETMQVINPRVSNINMAGSKKISGVEYHTAGVLTYNAGITNFYKNVYVPGSMISLNGTNVESNNVAVPTLNTASGDDSSKVIQITSSFDITATELFGDSAMIRISSLSHPMKANLSNTGSVTTGSFLLYNVNSPGNSNLSETFIDEDFRITSGSYDTQGSVTAGAATWTSTNHMTASGAAGHEDGLIFFNENLYSPKSSVLPGNGDFAAIGNGPTGNPDYSGITGLRTFYRKIQYTGASTVRDMKLTINKTSARINHTTPDANDIEAYIKLPGLSGWMDITSYYSYEQSMTDGNGVLINGADDNSNNIYNSGNTVHCITFGTQSINQNDYLVLKLVADASWTGYINSLSFQLNASDKDNVSSPHDLSNVSATLTGSVYAGNLSFGTSNAVSDYQNVDTDVGGGVSDVNDLYSASGNRKGIFTSFQEITGTLNDNRGQLSGRYVADAFNDGLTGSLVLEVNGADVHSIDIGSYSYGTGSVGAGTGESKNNLTGSGFTNIPVANFAEHSDGIIDYLRPYRTMKYVVHESDNRLGHNYLRVKHIIGGTTKTTNYVEWVVDTDNTTIALSELSLTDFGYSDVFYQSGVKYFASYPTASFYIKCDNVYRNIYSDEGYAVKIHSPNDAGVLQSQFRGASINSAAVGGWQYPLRPLNNSNNANETDLQITASVQMNQNISFVGDSTLISGHGPHTASYYAEIKHPIKADATSNTVEKTGFLVYSASAGSTNETGHEYFNLETYRVVANAYANQAAVTSNSNKWDSQVSINDAGSHSDHADGLLQFNEVICSPFRGGVSGDFRNIADGGNIQAPSGNPDYSTLTNSTRTYYRYFKNPSSVSTYPTFTITLYGDANLVSKSGAFYTGNLGANKNINVEVKVPYDPNWTGLDDSSTAWGDAIRPWEAGIQPTADGVGVYGGGGGSLNQTVGTGGRAISIQLQEKQIRPSQYFVVKITAHKDWTGYLSRVSINY